MFDFVDFSRFYIEYSNELLKNYKCYNVKNLTRSRKTETRSGISVPK